MKLFIKREALSVKGDFEVNDQEGKTLFYCQGTFLSVPKQFTISDMSRKIVGYIKNNITLGQQIFEIEDAQRTITLKQVLRGTYVINQTDWYFNEYSLGHHYELLAGKSLLMKLRKRWFTWGAHYELEIEDKQDVIIAIGIVLAIDYMNRPNILLEVLGNL